MHHTNQLPVESYSHIVSRYKYLRHAGRVLNQLLVERLDKDMLHEGARKLGFLHKQTLVFHSEEESSILMDYCLYNVRRNGRNTFEQYLIDTPPDSDPYEMLYLQATKHATFSFINTEAIERGLGIIARDLITNETFLLADIGLGSSAKKGLVLATRLIPIEGYRITGGAGIPLGILPDDTRDKLIEGFKTILDFDVEDFDPADLIRSCLNAGYATTARYDPMPMGSVVRSRKNQRQRKRKRVKRRK